MWWKFQIIGYCSERGGVTADFVTQQHGGAVDAPGEYPKS